MGIPDSKKGRYKMKDKAVLKVLEEFKESANQNREWAEDGCSADERSNCLLRASIYENCIEQFAQAMKIRHLF